ncbi:hypothetical protein REPUB_Repub19eG0042400 [Reevesia pubescens]
MWNMALLEMLFSADEANAISLIPVGHPDCNDKLVWNFSQDGNYSVKSGYSLLMELSFVKPRAENSFTGSQHDHWNKIWQLQVSPKIQNFLWRVCHNALATNENLHKRLHSVSDLCKRCELQSESIEHILFFCPFAEAVWGISSFSYRPRKEGFPGFVRWWNEAVETIPVFGSFSAKELIACLCWQLWKARNTFVFDSVPGRPLQVWNSALKDYSDLKAVIQPHHGRVNGPDNVLWTPPLANGIKINCDASFDANSKRVGIAAVARDCTGRIIDALIRTTSVLVAEALAIRLGSTLLIRNGWNNAILEADDELLIKRLVFDPGGCPWEISAIIEDVKLLTANVYNLSFSHVRRSGNCIADWVAKMSRQGRCPPDWMIIHPAELLSLLHCNPVSS